MGFPPSPRPRTLAEHEGVSPHDTPRPEELRQGPPGEARPGAGVELRLWRRFSSGPAPPGQRRRSAARHLAAGWRHPPGEEEEGAAGRTWPPNSRAAKPTEAQSPPSPRVARKSRRKRHTSVGAAGFFKGLRGGSCSGRAGGTPKVVSAANQRSGLSCACVVSQFLRRPR